VRPARRGQALLELRQKKARSLQLGDPSSLERQARESGFIKDDEVNADSEHAPLAERVPAVMERVRRWQHASGKHVMVAFNISDEHDAMLRHAELVEREGGSCVMASLNWCGLSAIQSLRPPRPAIVRTGMTSTPGATPAMPRALSATAPMVPAT
jgi:hypothetical protein